MRDSVHVVAGVLQDERGHFLICDRPRATSMQDYWEFPGGKVRPQESALSALRRELDEELGIQADTSTYLQTLQHEYDEFSVTIDFYLVTCWRGVPNGREGQVLRWVNKAELATAQLLPADAPLVQTLTAAV